MIIFRAFSDMPSPVAGFRPRRSSLLFTQNLPKLVIRTSSPDMRVSFMIFKRDSVTWVALVLDKPQLLYRLSIISALVSVIGGSPWGMGSWFLLEFLFANIVTGISFRCQGF